MIAFSRRIPTDGGYIVVAAGSDAVTVALYGKRGGYRGGDSLQLGMAAVAGAALNTAEGVILDDLERSRVDLEDLSAVPELGTG